MITKKSFLLLSLLFAVTNITAKSKPIHFIGTWYGGFFASMNCVLNHLDWCEKNNRTPVVYWDNRSLYYEKNGFNGSFNVWEYYFEPVSDQKVKPSKRITLTFSPGATPFTCENLDQTTRANAARLLKKYVKIKQKTQHKIDSFYEKKMAGKHTIGIHLRGTDKHQEEKLVSPDKIIETALQYANSDTQFLIASDEQTLLNKMIQLLKNRKVVFYDCYRSNNGKPLHIRSKKPPFSQMGEDVLVETHLLSKCDILVHTLSNVSSGALYINPTQPHHLVRLVS